MWAAATSTTPAGLTDAERGMDVAREEQPLDAHEVGLVEGQGADRPVLVDELLSLHEPDFMGVERLFFSRNVQTALGVGQARGVVLLAAAQHGTPVREATPNEVKSAIAGYGAADKEQVQRMVQLVLGMSELPRPDDAADALAIATWVANTDRGEALATAGVLDRAAVAPITRGETGYERAVREALANERAEKRSAS